MASQTKPGSVLLMLLAAGAAGYAVYAVVRDARAPQSKPPRRYNPTQDMPGAVLLGRGRASRYWRPEYQGRLVEQGGEVWLVPEGYFCRFCDGSGCKDCNWSGLDAPVAARRIARAARRRAKKARKTS